MEANYLVQNRWFHWNWDWLMRYLLGFSLQGEVKEKFRQILWDLISWAHCPRGTVVKKWLPIIVGKLTILPRSKRIYGFQYLCNSGPVCVNQLLRPIFRMRAHFLGQKNQTRRVNLPVVISLTERIQNANHVSKEHRMESVTETKLVAVIQHIYIKALPGKKHADPFQKFTLKACTFKQRNPRLTVHLNSQGKIFRMNVALTLSNWCRGKPNQFLIAKPNGLCMGSAMLVRTCCFYSPLPLREHETRLANTVLEYSYV